MKILIPTVHSNSVRVLYKIVAAVREHGDAEQLKLLEQRLLEYGRKPLPLTATDSAVTNILAALQRVSEELRGIVGD